MNYSTRLLVLAALLLPAMPTARAGTVIPGWQDLFTPLQMAVFGLAATTSYPTVNTAVINNSNVDIYGNEGTYSTAAGSITNTDGSMVFGTVYQAANGDWVQTGPGYATGGVITDPSDDKVVNQNALTDAGIAAGLTATQTFHGSITSDTSVVGNGGLNVINIFGDVSASLNFIGGPNDIFIVNITGNLKLTDHQTLGPLAGSGVTAGQVIYNFTGTGTKISGDQDSTVNGTILAPYLSSTNGYQGAGTTNGALFLGGSDQLLYSVNYVPFDVPEPNPSFFLLTGVGLIAFGVVRSSRASLPMRGIITAAVCLPQNIWTGTGDAGRSQGVSFAKTSSTR